MVSGKTPAKPTFALNEINYVKRKTQKTSV